MGRKRGTFHIALVILALIGASIACFEESREEMNEGKGSRENPVAARKYAITPDFEVRALSVVRPVARANDTPPEETDESAATAEATGIGETLEFEYMKVQFQVKCKESEEKICDLNEVRTHLQLVSDTGILYEPLGEVEGDPILGGDILGGAEKTGWLMFEVPTGLPITMAVATYGEEDRVFFRLP